MDENVSKAVAAADAAMVGCGDTEGVRQWQTIRARLVELEAENERLQSRLATADALLRDMRDGAFNIGGWADAIDEYFDAHLSELGT